MIFSTLTVIAGLSVIKNNIFNSIDKSINNSFEQFDDSVVKTRLQAEGLLSSAKNEMYSFLDKTVDELEGQEKKLWLFYQMALDRLDNSIIEAAKTGKLTAIDTGNIVSQVNPFSTKEPVIFWTEVEPPMYIHTKVKRTITAYGLNLASRQNQLFVGQVKASLRTATPSSIVFDLENITVKDGIQLNYVLSEEKLFFNNTKKCKIFINPISDNLGKVAVVYTKFKDKKDYTITRKWPFNEENCKLECNNRRSIDVGCTSTKRDTIYAQNGYRIITDTIQISPVEMSWKGKITEEINEITDRSENSFGFYLSIKAEKGWGRVISLKYIITWKEIKKNPEKETILTKSQVLRLSSKGISFRIPDDATPIALEYTTAKGNLERLELNSIRYPNLKVNHTPGSGVVEVIWNNK